jgi:hypothetical protein
MGELPSVWDHPWQNYPRYGTRTTEDLSVRRHLAPALRLPRAEMILAKGAVSVAGLADIRLAQVGIAFDESTNRAQPLHLSDVDGEGLDRAAAARRTGPYGAVGVFLTPPLGHVRGIGSAAGLLGRGHGRARTDGRQQGDGCRRSSTGNGLKVPTRLVHGTPPPQISGPTIGFPPPPAPRPRPAGSASAPTPPRSQPCSSPGPRRRRPDPSVRPRGRRLCRVRRD